MKQQAAVIYGKKDVRFEKIPITEPAETEVQIKVAYNGICGSDIHEYLDGMDLAINSHPLTGKKVPLVPGHEFAGTVVNIGKKITKLQIGDRVAVEPMIACGKCAACLAGNYNLCSRAIGKDNSAGFLGFCANGGLEEYCNVAEIFAHKLPTDFPLDLGALVEPTSVAVQAVLRAGLKAGDNILIQGAGPIGLFTLLVAQAAGAHNIIINDLSDQRLALAKSLGANAVLQENNPIDLQQKVNQLTGNQGVNLAFECAGVQATLAGALNTLGQNGTLMVVALFGTEPQIDVRGLLKKGGRLLTSYGYANVFERSIGIIDNNRETFKKIITKKIKLPQLIDEGILALAHDKQQAKILVKLTN
ncbi:MAG: alcohol dehydrogenase catalytic domain-containing protein [Liquorilactobacillus nagelii]|uniref:alcohol dehydrogenase catalytic domain-containing protein n=1 Tax=Liquorilactobacillus nagelii TaxID=82688 RepID=UPI0039E8F9C7